jgi:hypothetical protein
MRPWREGAAGPPVDERMVAQCDSELEGMLVSVLFLFFY